MSKKHFREEKKEKYILVYESGATAALGEVSAPTALLFAKAASKKDAKVKLIKITSRGGEEIKY